LKDSKYKTIKVTISLVMKGSKYSFGLSKKNRFNA